LLQLQSQEISFTSKIEKLQEKNARLSQELCEWRKKATVESEGRQLAEEEVRQLYDAHQQLQNENRSYAITLAF